MITVMILFARLHQPARFHRSSTSISLQPLPTPRITPQSSFFPLTPYKLPLPTQAIDIIDEAASRLRMRIESVPLIVKNVENELSVLRKKEATSLYFNSLNSTGSVREIKTEKEEIETVVIEKVQETVSVVTSPFISSAAMAGIESSIFSSITSTTTSSIFASKEISEKKETDREPDSEPQAYTAPLSSEMSELLSKRNEMVSEWQTVKGKLGSINKIRHFIESLKVALKSATKLGNHSKVDSLERFEIPNKEKEMVKILASISPDSPFYYLCDAVTGIEIANIMAKNTGIPMGNLLEGKIEIIILSYVFLLDRNENVKYQNKMFHALQNIH
jgi:ATP-dependent Clp protease ATP-binding subunit ClpA